MDLGCTVIDMGGGVTSFAVFHGNHMVYADAMPIGGQHVTSDIARGLTTTLNDAERLKVLYGSAVATGMDESELIDVPQIGEDELSHPNHVPRSLLVGIIQPRIQETLEMVQQRLKDSGVSNVAGRRVVLTGGASQIPGLRDLAQTILEKQVRLGHSIRVGGLADAVSGPAFATTAGLLIYASERHHESPSEIKGYNVPENIMGRVKHWLQENW
jgi:cell division protein FtsA